MFIDFRERGRREKEGEGERETKRNIDGLSPEHALPGDESAISARALQPFCEQEDAPTNQATLDSTP